MAARTAGLVDARQDYSPFFLYHTHAEVVWHPNVFRCGYSPLASCFECLYSKWSRCLVELLFSSFSHFHIMSNRLSILYRAVHYLCLRSFGTIPIPIFYTLNPILPLHGVCITTTSDRTGTYHRKRYCNYVNVWQEIRRCPTLLERNITQLRSIASRHGIFPDTGLLDMSIGRRPSLVHTSWCRLDGYFRFS